MKTLSHSSATHFSGRVARRQGLRPVLAALLVTVGLLCAQSRPARADLVPGLNVAFTVDALIGVGSLISIAGNAADLAHKKPTRGWMYSGFILGFMNTAIGVLVAPIILATSNPPFAIEPGNQSVCNDKATGQDFPCGADRPQIAIGMAIGHTVVGLTNMALAIRNAVIWHRQRVAAGTTDTHPAEVASATKIRYNVAPVVSRDLAGSPMYGLSLSLSGF